MHLQLTELRRFLGFILALLVATLILNGVSNYQIYRSYQAGSWKGTECLLTSCTFLSFIQEKNQNYSRYVLIFSLPLESSSLVAAESLTVANSSQICHSPNVVCYYKENNIAATLTLNRPSNYVASSQILALVGFITLVAICFLVIFSLTAWPRKDFGYVEINS